MIISVPQRADRFFLKNVVFNDKKNSVKSSYFKTDDFFSKEIDITIGCFEEKKLHNKSQSYEINIVL